MSQTCHRCAQIVARACQNDTETMDCPRLKREAVEGARRDRIYRAAAVDRYDDEGTLEIDDDATVSRSPDGGAYVQAWVWVPDDALGVKFTLWVEAEHAGEFDDLETAREEAALICSERGAAVEIRVYEDEDDNEGVLFETVERADAAPYYCPECDFQADDEDQLRCRCCGASLVHRETGEQA